MHPLSALPPLLMTLLATPALAQVTPWPLQNRPDVTTGDIHRYEMDRVRSQADASEALARSQALGARLTVQELQARRQPPLVTPETSRPLTLDQARRAREATEARTSTMTRSTSQIDAWLDRRPQ